MSDRGKRIFLALSIAIPFLLYSVYYYGMVLKNAPFRSKDFQSVTLKYGLGDSLVNQYNSSTGEFRYLNKRDSLVTIHVRLNKDDMLYLHHKAAELGFWDFPEHLSGTSKDPKTPHYYLEYKYREKTKRVYFDLDYNQNPKLHDAAKQLINEVNKVINDAADRQDAYR